MSRYDPHNQYDDGVPWWAKVLGILVIAAIGAVWYRLKTGQW